MLEISPVLAGTFDAPQYAPASNNIGSGQVSDSASTSATKPIDGRRYTQFDRTATDAGETTDFSFSDLLDTINPLQHIPVVSSVYREITGEKIHPVARVVGDILYGGLLGGATAALSGVSAVGDAVMEASTGKDGTGVVVAALFGPDGKTPTTETGDTQLASATSDKDSTAVAEAAATAAAGSAPPAAAAPTATPAPAALASAAPLPATPPVAPPPIAPQPFAKLAGAMPANDVPANADAQTKALLAAKAFPLDPKKMPFGGVMDPASLQGTNMALAAANGAPGSVPMNQMIRPGKLMQGPKVSAISTFSAATQPASPSATIGTSGVNAAASTPATGNSLILPPGTAPNMTPLSSELMQNLTAMRAISQYKNAGAPTAPVGGKVDLVN